MTWLAAEGAIVTRLRDASIAARAVVSRAELAALAQSGTDERWQAVGVVYNGYSATPDPTGCMAKVTQNWTTWCALWDVDGDVGARSAESSALVDAVIGALMGLPVTDAGADSLLTLAPARAPEDDAGSRLLPIGWQLTFDISA